MDVACLDFDLGLVGEIDADSWRRAKIKNARDDGAVAEVFHS